MTVKVKDKIAVGILQFIVIFFASVSLQMHRKPLVRGDVYFSSALIPMPGILCRYRSTGF